MIKKFLLAYFGVFWRILAIILSSVAVNNHKGNSSHGLNAPVMVIDTDRSNILLVLVLWPSRHAVV